MIVTYQLPPVPDISCSQLMPFFFMWCHYLQKYKGNGKLPPCWCTRRDVASIAILINHLMLLHIILRFSDGICPISLSSRWLQIWLQCVHGSNPHSMSPMVFVGPSSSWATATLHVKAYTTVSYLLVSIGFEVGGQVIVVKWYFNSW